MVHQKRTPDPANRFTVTIPATLPRYNQREHSMIPGVGPYSALITPIAG